MANRGKNLLEAFSHAKGDGAPTEVKAPPSRVESVSRSDTSLPGGDGVLSSIAPLVLGAVVLLALGFVLGRITAEPEGVQAGEPRTGEPGAGATWSAEDRGARPAPMPVPPAIVEPAGGGLSVPQQKLIDPANRFTTCAILYDDNDQNRQLASVTAGHLIQSGFTDTVAYPYDNGERAVIYVLVGMAPDYDTVAEQLVRLKQTNGPGGRRDFESAYVVEIDALITR
jgi:hypothetical protein